MGDMLAATNWLATIVAAVLAFVLGAAWYSVLFQKQWLKGVNLRPDHAGGAATPMVVQFIGTFLYAWAVGILQFQHALPTAILVTATLAVLVAASGLFAQKGRSSVIVEAGYIVAMGIVVMLVHRLL